VARPLPDPRERTEAVFEASPRWIRASLDGATVVDSRRAKLVWNPGRVLPVYAFPREDVALHALEPEHIAATYHEDGLEDHVVVDWKAMDHWYEEDEEVFVHPRDTHHRVDVLPSSRHVRVELDGVVLAESDRAHLLFETHLPTRYYFDPADVRMELLTATDTHTRCPYKGTASYWTAAIGDAVHDDIAWAYPDPLPGVSDIKDAISFFDERVDVYVDGEPQERPVTQWSRGSFVQRA
jgi:uncharacterized protein (DUF427 family)